MSFVDEDVEQTMFDEFHELQDEALTQREHAASLLTPEVTNSLLHVPNEVQSNEESPETRQDNLSTTTDLLALHDLLENEEPEEEAEKSEVEGSTSTLFDRLMKQDNSIFVTTDTLPQTEKNKSVGEAESKVIRNPLIETEGETPPWSSSAQPDEQGSDAVIEQFTAADMEHLSEQTGSADDDDEIDFDEADDAPFEKAATSSAEEGRQTTSIETKSPITGSDDTAIIPIDLPLVDDLTHSIENEVYTQEFLDKEQISSDQVDANQDIKPKHIESIKADEIYLEDLQAAPEKQFVDIADEIAAMFGHGVNDLSNVKVTHPQIAPYLETGEKLLRAKQINKWSDFIEELGVGGLNKQLLLQSNLVQHGEHFIIRIDERNKHLDEDQHRTTITEALSAFYQKPVTFEVQCGDVDETPFQIQQQISLVRQQHAHSVVETNDSIQELIKAFEGRVIEGSIKPR